MESKLTVKLTSERVISDLTSEEVFELLAALRPYGVQGPFPIMYPYPIPAYSPYFKEAPIQPYKITWTSDTGTKW